MSSSSSFAQPFKTDSLNPSSLPRATLGHLQGQGHGRQRIADGVITAGDNLTPEERAKQALEKEYEGWNERIDKELKGVKDGLKELVELANITATPSPLTSSTLPLHLPLRTSSLIRSTLNIRDIAHELKLLLLLSDEGDTVRRRDYERGVVRGEVESAREEVGREVRGLLGHGDDHSSQTIEEQRKEGDERVDKELKKTEESGKVVDQSGAQLPRDPVSHNEPTGEVEPPTEEKTSAPSPNKGHSDDTPLDEGDNTTQTQTSPLKAAPTSDEQMDVDVDADADEGVDVAQPTTTNTTRDNVVDADADADEDEEDDFEEVS
ncbi:hypothetical protein CI109_102510 [Kwoniella shandongensis]|uniref:Uncharacterized protein n=1 Tax=Kwoniella shandongensis TaxID=1734106 RepID=A0A5M6BZP7_9TREE|nr:uncharacterized protein CI109_003172 [Kwoniella shandongensis]KAA5528274.1 hypothetical protein CI109_003172 [Kwoniella shandongensis]